LWTWINNTSSQELAEHHQKVAPEIFWAILHAAAMG
jgi:hypothetical protein